jgi:DNA-directed RNA polymerase subunit RPC12/RpoP
MGTAYFTPSPELPRISPIKCARCGGKAPLMRRVPNSFKRGQFEIWTYECIECGHTMDRSVES